MMVLIGQMEKEVLMKMTETRAAAVTQLLHSHPDPASSNNNEHQADDEDLRDTNNKACKNFSKLKLRKRRDELELLRVLLVDDREEQGERC